MDSFFGIGVFELVFIIIFALIFLGPERLPGLFRQIIGVIRQVRDLTADVTRQFNDEFGDLTELDQRRQIQKALNETASDIKDATKPVSKALNKPAAKTTPNTAAKPATNTKPQPTAAKATTDVAAQAENSSEVGEATAAAAAAAAAASSSAATNDNPSPQNSTPSAQAASTDTADNSSSTATGDGEEKAAAKPRPTPKQPSAEDQISPASAYFAEKSVQSSERSEKPKRVTTATEDDFTENAIAPPPAARQTPAKETKASQSPPAETTADTPLSEPAAEEESA